jgi:hypothetical protein
MCYGTGAKPSNGTPATGTIIGGVSMANCTAADMYFPLGLSAVITGLTLGTAYWLDICGCSAGNGAGSVTLMNVAFAAHEF